MANVENMSNPVTRSELQAELRPIQHNIEVLNGDVAKLKVDVAELKVDVAELKVDVAEVKGRLQRVEERMATRHDLEIWAGALMARTDEKFKLADQRMDRFEQQMKESERRLLNEVASHMKAYQEAMITQINVIQEQYADLPPRTSRLETAVFGARQR